MKTPPIPRHHDVFDRFERGQQFPQNAYFVSSLGVRTHRSFLSAHLGPMLIERPAFNEEYFEWVDLLEAVVAARETFTMIELGAGYGRWLVNAAAAVRCYSDLRCRLIGVEAEPTHFRWMKAHFKDNGLPVRRFARHRIDLIRAAVAADRGSVWFHVGDPSDWYGQAISDQGPAGRDRNVLTRTLRRAAFAPSAERSLMKVRAVTARSLLKPLARVDLIDLDVQGAELSVLSAAADELARKVKRVHIGTHGLEPEEGLRALFGRLGWTKINDYPCGETCATPWGEITFQDGVQTWINPVLQEGRQPMPARSGAVA